MSVPAFGYSSPTQEKNGDAPGPPGDVVMWLVAERTKTKEKQTNKEK